MKICRSMAIAFGFGLLLTAANSPILAQTTGAGATGATTGGGGGGGGGGGAAATGATATAVTISTKGPTSGAGSTTSIPSNSNPFVQTYVDYLALGNPKNYATTSGANPPKITTSTFGKPIYGNVATTASAGIGAATTTTTGFTSIGIIRSPSYITALSDEIPFVVHMAPTLQADARAIIDRCSSINNKENIQVVMEGTTIVLRGQVGTEKERRTAETQLRMTPGMREVRNELQVVGALARR